MILLLSDLHLPNEPSPLREGFLRFLAEPARAAREVYLLGDLFEYWVGDDVGLHDYAAEARALQRLVESGVAVYFMPGNRDFLVGARFFATTGVQELSDPSLVTLGGVATLLAHGDRYCSDDLSYQRWRRFSRNALAQRLFAQMPQSLRRKVAGGVRAQSRGAKTRKPAMIMDVSEIAIVRAMQQAGVTRLIHGHTHRPGHHRLRVAGREAERIVLPDWRPDLAAYVCIDESGTLTQHTIPLA